MTEREDPSLEKDNWCTETILPIQRPTPKPRRTEQLKAKRVTFSQSKHDDELPMIENPVPTARRKFLSFQQHEDSVTLEDTAQQLDTDDTTSDNVSQKPALNSTGDKVECNRDMELI